MKNSPHKSSPRKYLPLTTLGRGPVCPMCQKRAADHQKLQEHLNAAHPGWAEEVVKKLGITSE
jgi:hypothetical protein